MSNIPFYHDLLLGIFASHNKAHDLIEKGMYSQAHDLLCEVLEARTIHKPVCEWISTVDIAATHVDIGNVLQLMSLHGDAAAHFYRAWVCYSTMFGLGHQLTRKIELKWVRAIDLDHKLSIYQHRRTAPAA